MGHVTAYVFHGGPLNLARLAFGGEPPREYRHTQHARGGATRAAVYTLRRKPDGERAYKYERTE